MTTAETRPAHYPSGCTDDAAEWARCMAASALKQDDDLDALVVDATPGGWLHAWLCNAIETGKAIGASSEARTGHHASAMRAALGDNWRSATGGSGE